MTTDLLTPVGNFRWIDHWMRVPDPQTPCGSCVHGLAVTRDGRVLVFHRANPAMLIYSPEGKLLDAWGNDYFGAHCVTIVEERGEELLWLIDENTPAIHKTDFTGRILQKIERPPHPVYEHGGIYKPTQPAINEERFGGNGDIWITDGYGSYLVHRYNARGKYLSTLTGTESGLTFKNPHGSSFIYRGGQRELWVADRGNKTVQVFDEEGNFLRRFGQDFLICPNGFTQTDGWILVPELLGRLTAIDQDGRLLGHIGENPDIMTSPGWPDHPPCGIISGKFNSPHYGAFDAAGSLYMCEWLHGGRVTKLEKLP